MNIIEVENFKMQFGDNIVIKNLSFSVKQGEVFGLLGSNGSGKTTTVRALLNFHQPTSGTLLIKGEKYTPNHTTTIGYLPEERGLYKKEKVGDIMRYFAELKGLTKPETEKFIQDFLNQVELTDKQNIRLDKLSSGQQQKIQLGVTIMGKPDLLILDEPTKGFDPVSRRLLLQIIENERKRGATVMMITHQMEEAERLCDRVLLLKDGVAKVYGNIEDIKDQAGNEQIKLIFSGKLPTNPTLFSILKQDKNQAQLQIASNKTAEEVLKFLVQNNTKISFYAIERPSLDDIFVNIYGDQSEKEVHYV